MTASPSMSLGAAASLLVLLAPRPGVATEPVPCKENHGNQLQCAGEIIYGLTVTPSNARDGTYSYVSWKEYFGDQEHWRTTSIYDTGQLYFVVDDGQSNAGKWWPASRWIFPRAQRLRILRYPNQPRFDVVDPTGTAWTLVGTPMGQYDSSFAVERIGVKQQTSVPLAMTDRGVVGLELASVQPLFMLHKFIGFNPHTNYLGPEYNRAKSTFSDRRGSKCAVANRELFAVESGGKGQFKFETDDTLVAFLAARCPKLDLEALRAAKRLDSEPPTSPFNMPMLKK